MTDSTVYVTAETDGGGQMQYKLSMVRDLIGWKVSNLELYPARTNGFDGRAAGSAFGPVAKRLDAQSSIEAATKVTCARENGRLG